MPRPHVTAHHCCSDCIDPVLLKLENKKQINREAKDAEDGASGEGARGVTYR
jgi:hypothetical protein